MRENSDLEVQKVVQIVELSGILLYIRHNDMAPRRSTDRHVTVRQQIS